MIRKIDNPLSSQFYSVMGDCALQALAYIFGTDKNGIIFIMKKTGWRPNKDGVTKEQCDRALKILCAAQGKRFKYVQNKNQLNVGLFQNYYKQGDFILDMDGHVSSCRDGILVDFWNPWSYRLLGWWEITNDGFVDPRPAINYQPQPYHDHYSWI